MHSMASEGTANHGKYRHIASCFLPQLPFVLLALGAFWGGLGFLLPAIFLLVIVPLLDLVTGWQDDVHFQKQDFSAVDTFFLHWNSRVYAILYVIAVIWMAMSVARLTALETVFLTASLSILGGICFAAAHELLHGKEGLDQILQRITTVFLFYPHYKLIHIQSHHAHAATTHDENTAWFDESIYRYLFRTIPGSMVRCWQMESARSGKDASVWRRIARNRMSAFAVGQIALVAGFYALAGLHGLLAYFAQLIGAHVVLESVNYIQHYGLMRREEDGQYEKTAAEHSWDTYHYFSSYSTFRVGHHSYHHISVKPYYLLAVEPEAPKLPVGYFWAIAMVLIPPWWRRVINPKLCPVGT